MDFSQPLGRTDGREVITMYRPGLRVICGTTDRAIVLQQIIFLTRIQKSEWVQASASYVGDPLCIPERTVGTAFEKLREAGFIESEQRERGKAMWHRVKPAAIVKALKAEGFDTDARALLGYPREIREDGTQDSRGAGARDSRQEHQEQKEPLKILSSANNATDLAFEVKLLWREMKDVWPEATSRDATTVLRKLRALGMPTELATKYAIDRTEEFGQRARVPALKFAKTWMTGVRDLAQWGYHLTAEGVVIAEPGTDPPPEDTEKGKADRTPPKVNQRTGEEAPSREETACEAAEEETPGQEGKADDDRVAPWSWTAFTDEVASYEKALKERDPGTRTAFDEAYGMVETAWKHMGHSLPDE